MMNEPEAGRTGITPENAGIAEADVTDPMFVSLMLDRLRKAGAGQDIEDLLARDPAGQCELDERGMVVTLAWCLSEAGADDQVSVLLNRLSTAGEWSLLNEIHELTGLAVASQERGPAGEQRAEHGDR